MKTILISTLIVFSAIGCKGQTEIRLSSLPFSKQDSIKASTICAERGHIMIGSSTTTLAYCPPYTIDTDSTTVEVYPACNSSWAECQRCHKVVVYQGQEVRRVIWKREPKSK